MASIPNNLTASQKSARQSDLQSKQNWFKYKDNSALPWLDPLSIPLIINNMQEVEGFNYWVSKKWQKEFDKRLEKAEGTVMQPPYAQTANAFETYPDFTSSYSPEHNLFDPPMLDSDESFAAQRLSGANPLMIRKVGKMSDLPSALAISNGDGPDGIKIDQAIIDGRLYICDSRELGFIAGPGDTDISRRRAGRCLG